MVKAIRIRAYQNMPSYRKPMSIAIQDSYKLPPYSTVIGMVHTACGFSEYHPMDVSIAGRYHTSVVDMYKRYYFGMKLDYSRHQLYVDRESRDGIGGEVSNLFPKDAESSKERDGITTAQGYAEVLVDMELLIYVIPKDESEIDLIAKGIQNPVKYPSLGRYEDLLRIDEVKVVELYQKSFGEFDDGSLHLNYDTYVPMCDDLSEYKGTMYVLNKVFSTNTNNAEKSEQTQQTEKPSKSKKKKEEPFRRIIQTVKAKLLKQGVDIEHGTMLCDIVDDCEVGVFPQ